jgi:hypothetical protein
MTQIRMRHLVLLAQIRNCLSVELFCAQIPRHARVALEGEPQQVQLCQRPLLPFPPDLASDVARGEMREISQ